MINIFNGFVISYPAMPVYWRWLNRLAPPTWMLYGLAASQLGNLGVDVIRADGSTLPVRQYLIETYDYDYDFRWGGHTRTHSRAHAETGKGKREE